MNVNNVVRTITIRGTSEGLEKLTGDVNKFAAAQQNVAIVSETSARRVLSLEDAWKKQSLKLDEAARSQANIARETKIADGALREGLITQQQHAERLNLISQRYAVAGAATQKFTQQSGLARHELINLSRQAQDVGVSLASGQSPFLVLAQQGSQIADVFASSTGSVRGFASQAIGWLGRFAASAAGVATGALAIGAGALYAAGAWQDSQREIDKALIGIGKRSGVTVNDINQIARSSASATGLSVDEARTAALEFVKTGAIYKDNIKAATDVTRNFAIVTGQDAKDAAQELAKSLASPLEGADALNTKLGFLDGRTREYIATLVSQNQKQEAQAVLLRNLAPAIQEATNTLGPFERAWNAVANAASNAKNAVGAALTPRTDEQRRDALAQQVGQATPSTGFLPGTPVTSGDILRNSDIKRAKGELDNLNETLRETARARALAFGGEVKISSDADEAVRALLPYIDQLKKVEEQLNKIKAAQENPGAKDRQGLGGSNEAAARAAEVLKMNLKSTADETDRANSVALRLAHSYGTSSLEVAKTRAALSDQLGVASAVGGQARLAAQEQATFNELIRQGKSAEDASAIASQQRAVAQAQINTNAQETLFSLQNQRDVASAITGQQQIAAQAEATKNQLIHDGVDGYTAQRIASEQMEQSVAKVNAGIEQQVFSLKQQTDLIYARQNGTEATVKAEQAYTNAIRAGADESEAARLRNATLTNEEAKAAERVAAAADEALRRWRALGEALKFLPLYLRDIAGGMDNLFNSKQGGKSQFDPKGYKSSVESPQLTGAKQAYGVGGFAVQNAPFGNGIANIIPNAQGYQYQTDKYLSGGREDGTIAGAIERLAKGGFGVAGGGGSFGSTQIDQAALQTLQRLTNLMDDGPEKISVLQSAIADLREQPLTIAREEAIKQLNEQIKQLTEATESNTDALNAQLDPLFSQGHDYLNSLRIGFYQNALGGIMGRNGPIPLQQFADGGITSRPTLFSTSENFHEEAIIPLKNGAVPVAINDNSQRQDDGPDIVNNTTNQYYGPGAVTIVDQPGSRRNRLTPGQRRQGFS